MFRSKTEILRALDPTRPETVQALIDFHRRTLGGFVMEAGDGKDGGSGSDGSGATSGTGGQAGGQGEDTGGTGDSGKDGDGKALGPNGEKALQTERDARKRVEKELADFKASQAEQTKKLAEAFGIKTDDGKPSSDEVVAALQKQVTDIQRENLVFRVVTDPAHTITDPADLKLITAMPDEAAMRELATRLAKKPDDTGDGKAGANGTGRRFPRQDDSQGRGNNGEQKPTSVAAVIEERRAAREKRNA